MSARTIALALAAAVLLAGCGNGSFGSTVIGNGDILVRGDQVILRGTDGSEARLAATGDLAVDGHDVAVDATQRQLLQQYYQAAQAVRDHGLATGKAGAALAVRSLENAAGRISGHGSRQADAELDGASRKVHQEASRICLDLRQIRSAQDRLAVSLAAFRPFARLIDDEDNGKDTARHCADGT